MASIISDLHLKLLPMFRFFNIYAFEGIMQPVMFTFKEGGHGELRLGVSTV